MIVMKLNKIFLIILSLLLVVGAGFFLFFKKENTLSPIKVGILHSLTGTMAQSEKPVVDATLFAIHEINQAGGIFGRKIEPIIFDGKSDWPTFAKGAEKLITEDKVSVIFGCWTSASRKMVKEVVERYNHLLFYPVQYEGKELSPNIIYTGSAPNQQIIPGATWAFFNLGKRFFLVGSDYIFPRGANETIKKVITDLGGEIVGEEYIPLGSNQVSDAIEKITKEKPDVILNTINGDTNFAFFHELREVKNITPEEIPTMSFSLVESEFSRLGTNVLQGDYAVWSYFHSIDTPENKRFIENFQKFKKHERISDPMEAAYFGVHLWAIGAIKSGSFEPLQVRDHVKDLPFNAPEGMIYIDGSSQHTWKFVRVGKLRGNNNYEIIWDSAQAMKPEPFPFNQEWIRNE